MTYTDALVPSSPFRGHSLSKPFFIGESGYVAINGEIQGNAIVDW